MAEAHEAETALYDAVIALCKNAEEYRGTTKGAMVRDAAIAFRAAFGGLQPGGIPMKD